MTLSRRDVRLLSRGDSSQGLKQDDNVPFPVFVGLQRSRVIVKEEGDGILVEKTSDYFHRHYKSKGFCNLLVAFVSTKKNMTTWVCI